MSVLISSKQFGATMKLFLFISLFSSLTLAEKLDGVDYNCLTAVNQKALKIVDHSLTYACRARADQAKEYYAYCNGSGCTGFTMTFKNNRCVLTDRWTGQDDQDTVDQTEYAAECLVASDFNDNWSQAPKTNLNSIKIGDRTEIANSRVYQITGNSAKANNLEVAEAVGKQIRHEYYKQNYQVDRQLYREISASKAESLLATSEGEFKALAKKDLDKISEWFENHQVAAVVQMNLITNYMSGTGVEDNFIYIPTDKSEPVLVINRFTYSE